jgi:integrase
VVSADFKNTPQVDTGKPNFKRVAQCLYRNSANNIYYALVKKRGKQHRKSLKTSDRQLAGRRLIEFRGQIDRFVVPTKDRNITFIELAKDWFDTAKTRYKPSSARAAAGHLKQLNKHFGISPVRNITLTDIHNWEKSRGATVSASSFNHEKSVFVAILNHAIREGLILENRALTIARRKTPKRKIVIPSKEQFTTLVNTIRSFGCRAWDGADLIEILAYSGMRLSEATGMVWADIDFERSQFAVTGGAKGTKNHEARVVPLFPALRALFERIKQKKKVEQTEKVLGIGSAKKAIGHACKKAGLPHFHHHLFRHFFVSQAIENGVDFKTITAWEKGGMDSVWAMSRTFGRMSWMSFYNG